MKQIVVSVEVTLGAGITVTVIESLTLAHGELATPVKISHTESEVIVGVYVVIKEFTLLNVPVPLLSLHTWDATLLTVAVLIVIEGVVEQIVTSVAVTLGAGITVTTIVAKVLAQGAFASPVKVNVTEPVVMDGE